MSLRIHFSTQDLARTRFATEPDPMWETLLSLHMVQTDDEPDVYGSWRKQTRESLNETDRRLLALTPPEGYSPDFLTPAESADGMAQGLRAVERTTTARVRRELDSLASDTPVPSWAWSLTRDDGAALRGLAGAMGHYYQRALAPHWRALQRQVDADLDSRARLLLAGGLADAAPDLHPRIHWKAPVLEIDLGHVDSDLHLDGRGLRIVPSFFCWRHPIALRDTDLRPVLVYPVRHDPSWLEDRSPGGEAEQRAMDDLLGGTRAKVLREIGRGPCSTTELAERAGVSLASASEHARVLAAAGLTQTRRVGRSVRHSIHASGSRVLRDAG